MTDRASEPSGAMREAETGAIVGKPPSPEGCVEGLDGCGGFWPLDCPEPMLCAIDHLCNLAGYRAVRVTQFPYSVSAPDIPVDRHTATERLS